MIRTFIYGSCVSRDTFTHLDSDTYSLTEYVARQSLLSAFTPGDLSNLPHTRLDSAFQRRNLERDWLGSFPSLLRQHAPAVDLLLWDLFDERLGVRQLASAPEVFSTRSVESLGCGLDDALGHLPTLGFGTREHLHRFHLALKAFGDLLLDLDLMRRTLLIAPEWATHSLTGSPAPASFGITPARANVLLQPYLEAIARSLSVHTIRPPRELVRSDPRHQWGEAPFHYSSQLYTYTAQQIHEFMNGFGTSG